MLRGVPVAQCLRQPDFIEALFCIRGMELLAPTRRRGQWAFDVYHHTSQTLGLYRNVPEFEDFGLWWLELDDCGELVYTYFDSWC